MADQKLTDLTEDTAPAVTSVVYAVVGGADRQVQITNLFAGSPAIVSNPPSTGYTITNIYLNASLEIVVVYNDVAIP